MASKFRFAPGMEEHHHELLEKHSPLHFMSEILNPHLDKDHRIAYFRNVNNGSIVATTKSPHRVHLEFTTNIKPVRNSLFFERHKISLVFLSTSN